MKETFGQILRDTRRSVGISQRDLAKKVGVDFSYISKLENDKLPPPAANTIERIASVLEVDSAFLLSQANKIPTDIKDSLSTNAEAIKFISKATNMNLTKDEWSLLTDNLKSLR